MRKTNALFKMIPVALTLAALAACSSGNNSAPAAIDVAGKHAVAPGYTSWVQQHWVEYEKANGGSSELSSATGCSQCHGSDLLGGSSKVSCFSTSFRDSNGILVSCHPNVDRTLGHPSSWSDPTSAEFHGKASFNGEAVLGSAKLGTSCGLCHATDADVVRLGSVPSCLSTDPKWGIACHASSPALNSQGCVSCHAAAPVGPNGASAPNRQGKHIAHLALGIGCRTCHTNGGTGTAQHGIGLGRAYLNLSTGYKAQSGAFSYAAGKCSSVACHGGQQSPDWFGTTGLDLSLDCESCHAQANPVLPQYNSYFSGQRNGVGVNLHQFHLAGPNGFTIGCTTCHAQELMGAHLGNLATPGFEVPADQTLSSALHYVKATGSCTIACHFGGGANPDPNGVIFRWK
jgi:predicted CxxxxCH...CXXCH cytochrome family protein